MQYFTRPAQLLLAALSLALALPALAAGTSSGTSIVNAVTLDYSVNGGAQPQQTDSVSFVVDTKLDVQVRTTDLDWITVTIGQEFAGLSSVPAINFTVDNQSNTATPVVAGVLDKALEQIDGFTPLSGGETAFDREDFLLAIDVNDNNTYEDGTDTILTAVSGVYNLGSLAEDATLDLLLVVDVPSAATPDQYESWTLVAAAGDGSGGALAQDDSSNISPGSGATPSDTPNDLAAVEVVFADFTSGAAEDDGFNFFSGAGTGSDDADFDGQSADSSGFRVIGVAVLVAKYAEVIYDPVSENRYDTDRATVISEPKAIPGAVIMYVVGITNQDPLFTADGIAISDDIPDGAGPFEPVDEGNQSGAAVTVPENVTVDFDPGPGTNNVSFTLPGSLDLDQIYSENCDAVPVGTTVAYSGDVVLGGPDSSTVNPEVSAVIGQCAPSTDGYVVYFVTVETQG